MVGFQSVPMHPWENRIASTRIHAEILIHDLHEIFVIKSSPDGFEVGDGFQTLERRRNTEEGFYAISMHPWKNKLASTRFYTKEIILRSENYL